MACIPPSLGQTMLVGNIMVAAPFIAYIGPFNSEFRSQLWVDTWVPDLRGREIPCSDDLDPYDPRASRTEHDPLRGLEPNKTNW
eukprot:3079857-Prymnesium_polylepis.1